MFEAFHIGALVVDPPVALAPMSGYSTLPMRLLSRRAGAGIVYTELLSATGLHYRSRRTRGMMALAEGERPVGVQLFGAEPQWMAEAARVAVEQGTDLVDLNMGCAVPKVMKAGAGAALLGMPERATEIVRAVRGAVACPVTVKLRAGLSAGDRGWLALAVRLVEAGAAALTLHARTAAQHFTGRADWRAIAALAAEVPVPVIGNGDVDGAPAAVRMLEETGCAGVMIGRAALGNPWIFSQVRAALRGEAPPREPTPKERGAVALCHLQMLATQEGERRAVLEMRPLLVHYLRGLPGARHWRAGVIQARSIREVEELLVEFLGGCLGGSARFS
jgi:nifR3 family TIM-barrel protein